MEIRNVQVWGLEESLVRAAYPMMTEIPFDEIFDKVVQELYLFPDSSFNEDYFRRANNLGSAPIGSGHDKFLRGCIVQADIIAPRYFWQEWDTYHFNESISSQSTMHCITKFNVRKMCNEYVDEIILDRYMEILQEYKDNPTYENFMRVKSNLPEGLEIGRGISTSYASLKTIYSQRRFHRLPEWKIVTDWISSLPYAKEIGLLG